MNDLTLSGELAIITAEIQAFKNVAGQAVFEIGRRLADVRDRDLAHGQWDVWCNAHLKMSRRQANKYIRVFERFSNGKLTSHSTVEALDALVDFSDEQLQESHIIPSTGETKTVDEMTRREITEVKQALAKAERERDEAVGQAQSLMERDRKIIEENERLKRQKSPEPQVVEKRVEVIPESIQRKMSDDQATIKHLKADYEEVKAQLASMQIQQGDTVSLEAAAKKRERLRLEADISTLQIKVEADDFLRKTSMIAFMEGALAAANPAVKKQILESVDAVEKFLKSVRRSLESKIIVEEANFQEG